MRKEDLYLLARRRKLPHTSPSLWKMSVDELEALVLPATDEELAALEAQAAERLKFGRATVSELKQKLTNCGLVASAGTTRGGMIDMLLDPSSAAPPTLCAQLDEFQNAAVAKSQEMGVAARASPQTLLISAGPGAGKTTTVVHMLKQLVEASFRVLVLAFNVEAEKVLQGRAKAAGLQHKHLVHNNAIWLSGGVPGVAILTFDKFAYQVNAEASAAAEADSYFSAAPGGYAPRQQSYDFRKGKENAAKHLREGEVPPPRFDIVIVDEAQDVTGLEAGLVSGVLSRGPDQPRPLLVCAGDPRQEIYTGAVWFSHMWSMPAAPGVEKTVLRNNYRSHPQIVAALNAFSRNAFPTLHHDQLAAREPEACENESPRVVATTAASLQEAGRAAGSLMATKRPDQSYAISPVTIEKYKIAAATAAIRQELHEASPGNIAMALTGSTSIPAAKEAGRQAAAFLMATSRKIKGTERDQVVVYGADRNFINVDRPALAKLLYVALSRARENLVIINCTEKGELANCHAIRLLEPVLRLSGGATAIARTRRGRPRLLPLPVTGSMSASAPEGGRSHCVAPFPLSAGGERIGTHTLAVPKIDTALAVHDADFVGCLVEAHVVSALGLRLMEAGNLEYKREESRALHGVSYDSITSRYQIRTSAANIESLRAAFPNADGTPYHHALLSFSTLCGKVWTVSERFLGPGAQSKLEAGAAAVAATIRDTLEKSGGGTEISHWNMFRAATVDCRGACTSTTTAVMSSGVPDLETDRCVIELKHCNETTESHRRQLLNYMALRGRRLGMLYNTKTGRAELFGTKSVAPFRTYAGCIAKVVSFVTQARSIGIWLDDSGGRISMPALKDSTTLISLDVENDDEGRVTEIGAVAVSLTDWSVLGVFQERARGVLPIPDSCQAKKTRIEGITNLRAGPEFGGDAAQSLARSFQAWMGTHAGATVLHWGGSERALAGEATCVDCLSKVFRPWLEYRGQARIGACTLACAMQQVLPELPFVPHQALEDAAATLAIFAALVDTSGAL